MATSSRRAPLGERLGAHRRQRLVGGPQLDPGVTAAVRAAQPLAVQQPCPCQSQVLAAASELVDRLAVVLLSRRIRCGERVRQGLGPESPGRAGGRRALGETVTRLDGKIQIPVTRRRLGQLAQPPAVRGQRRVRHELASRCQGRGVVAEAVVQHGPGVAGQVGQPARTGGVGVPLGGGDPVDG